MESLLDYDGFWSMELITLMVTVAKEVETEESARQFNAVFAAAGSLMSEKPAAAFSKGVEASLAAVRTAQLVQREAQDGKVDARDLVAMKRRQQAAAALQGGFAGLRGLKPSKKGVTHGR